MQPAPQQQMTPEQVEELKEKIKNMSPEELREFQKQQCIFCHIVSGKVNAKKIYEDEKILAILDINPANPGHMLVLPKEHYVVMPQVPEDILEHLILVVKQLSNSALRGLGAQGTNIIVANGPAAGQKAQHFMAHIIPRKENDDLKFNLPQKQIDEKTLDDVKEKVSRRLHELLGKKYKAKKEGSKEPIPSAIPKKEVEEAEKEIKKQKSSKKTEKKETEEEPEHEETKKPASAIDEDELKKALSGKDEEDIEEEEKEDDNDEEEDIEEEEKDEDEEEHEQEEDEDDDKEEQDNTLDDVSRLLLGK